MHYQEAERWTKAQKESKERLIFENPTISLIPKTPEKGPSCATPKDLSFTTKSMTVKHI